MSRPVAGIRVGTSQTLREAADAWLEGVRSGTIRNRGGHVYKPSVIRGYEAALTARVLPDLGVGRSIGSTSRTSPTDCAPTASIRARCATR